MIIYLPMKKGIRTKVNTEKMKAYRQNTKLIYPANRHWRETPITDEIFEEIRNRVNCESK